MERLALLFAVAYLGLHAIPRAWAKLNTDFPNYYLSARLAHEGFDTGRLYEWTWLQREKDHRSIDVPIIGLIPITPFSTLIMWPLTSLPALVAKHVWILVNLALLLPLSWLLRSLTTLTYQRIALVLAFSIPLNRNLLFGQYYIFLLVLIVAACWAYVRELYVLSGALIAIAAACKIFPVLFLVLFLRRRAWRALLSAAVTGFAALAISIVVFGWNVHRTYLHEILPWTLHGEGMPPYVTSAASISSILHYLLLSEPQWNPHPWHNSPLLYALLQPTLQMLMLAPAVLLIRRHNRTSNRIVLEWAALLTVSLAISTMPASYQFVLMVFPACVLVAMLLERRSYGWLILLFLAYFVIGIPMGDPGPSMGLTILLHHPRLPLMLAVLLGTYVLLWKDRRGQSPARDWTQYAWATLAAVAALLAARSSFHLQQAVRQEYAYRVPFPSPSLLQADPVAADSNTTFVAASGNGYHLTTAGAAPWVDTSMGDDLSFAVSSNQIWVEKDRSGDSAIVDLRDGAHVIVAGGREPILSADGQDLAFIRSDHGRGRLAMRQSFRTNGSSELSLTPPSFNVYEATFLSATNYAVSAAEDGRPPQIYRFHGNSANAPLALGESRYPALSPDEHWMAFSRLEHGVWNLWLRNEETGTLGRVADVPCNQIQPSWEKDSKTLVYATDCGRSLWLTAVARRRVIP
jgi:hypothetical protein